MANGFLLSFLDEDQMDVEPTSPNMASGAEIDTSFVGNVDLSCGVGWTEYAAEVFPKPTTK